MIKLLPKCKGRRKLPAWYKASHWQRKNTGLCTIIYYNEYFLLKKNDRKEKNRELNSCFFLRRKLCSFHITAVGSSAIYSIVKCASSSSLFMLTEKGGSRRERRMNLSCLYSNDCYLFLVKFCWFILSWEGQNPSVCSHPSMISLTFIRSIRLISWACTWLISTLILVFHAVGFY